MNDVPLMLELARRARIAAQHGDVDLDGQIVDFERMDRLRGTLSPFRAAGCTAEVDLDLTLSLLAVAPLRSARA